MAKPTTLKELRGYIWFVNFYPDVPKGRPLHMAPLTDLIDRKKGQVQWTEEATKAFENVKKMCAEDTTLFYPDLNKMFDVYMNASEYQLGGIISQEGRSIAYYSKNLTST